MRQVAHAAAAVCFFHGQAQQALLTEQPPQLRGEDVVVIGRRGEWGDMVAGEGGHAFAQQIDVFAKLEIQGRHMHETAPLRIGTCRWERAGPRGVVTSVTVLIEEVN